MTSLNKKPFPLVDRLPEYVFAHLYKKKEEYSKYKIAGDIIDFGIGSPDAGAPSEVTQYISEKLQNKTLHGYAPSNGIEELRRAAASYYRKRFSVELDHNEEIVSTIGAKEGIASLARAIGAEGSTVFLADPYYPIHRFGFEITGTNVKLIPYSDKKIVESGFAAEDHEQYFLTKFKEAIEEEKKAGRNLLAVVVCYPSNPSARICSRAFFEELIKICKKEHIYIISDLAYCEIYFDEDHKPCSILEIEGARDIAIEFTSMSKSFSMAGFRIGFACGNKKLVSALSKIKSYLDYGTLKAIQMGASMALNNCNEYLTELRNIYRSRSEIVIEEFGKVGWEIPKSHASMFVWSEIPAKWRHLNSMQFCEKMIEQAGVVASPGSSFGECGDGYVRVSLVQSPELIREAATRIAKVKDR